MTHTVNISRLFQHRGAKVPRTPRKDRDRDRRNRDSNCPLQSVCRRRRRAIIVGATFLAQSLLSSPCEACVRFRIFSVAHGVLREAHDKAISIPAASMAVRKNQPNEILLATTGLFASEDDVSRRHAWPRSASSSGSRLSSPAAHLVAYSAVNRSRRSSRISGSQMSSTACSRLLIMLLHQKKLAPRHSRARRQ